MTRQEAPVIGAAIREYLDRHPDTHRLIAYRMGELAQQIDDELLRLRQREQGTA